jgi:hypothetical protein
MLLVLKSQCEDSQPSGCKRLSRSRAAAGTVFVLPGAVRCPKITFTSS